MYILKNALRCIWRAKGRNVLIGLVVLLLSVSSCIGLSIKQANKTLKKQYADDMEITATLNSKNMRKNGSIALDTLSELADNKLVKNFYYSSSVYFAAGEGIEPLDVAGSFGQNKDFKNKYGDIKNGEQITSQESVTEDTSADIGYSLTTLANDTSSESTDTESQDETEHPQESQKLQEDIPVPPMQNDVPIEDLPNDFDGSSGNSPSPFGGSGSSGKNNFITKNFFFNMASMNDFTVISYSSDDALPEYVSTLSVIKSDDKELNCVISNNLADENGLETGSTFTLKNPDNEDEVYTFTVSGICDTSQSSESQDTSSNASFTDNYIYISSAALDSIIENSASVNPASESEDGKEKSDALTATHSGTFVFANLDNYTSFGDALGDDYTLVSEDVLNYEQSISQLETLGKYATYFLIVIFVIGAFVLIIINLFCIRNRKYEIGVLTAIGMKKYKVAVQFVIELFVVTFAALIVGSAIGSVTSVPVTNSLLTSINTQESDSKGSETSTESGITGMPDFSNGKKDGSAPPDMPSGGFKGAMDNFGGRMNNYVTQIRSATDLTVIIEMILVGMGLTLISSLAAVIFVMRYEPLKILNNRD